jgi:hypothetical protein
VTGGFGGQEINHMRALLYDVQSIIAERERRIGKRARATKAATAYTGC